MLDGLSLSGEGWATVCAFDGYSTDLLAACADLGLEGLVAKRVDAPTRRATVSVVVAFSGLAQLFRGYAD